LIGDSGDLRALAESGNGNGIDTAGGAAFMAAFYAHKDI